MGGMVTESKIALADVENVLKNEGISSEDKKVPRKLFKDEEEDAEIEYSMPIYFDHLYGHDGVPSGCSRTVTHTLSPSSSYRTSQVVSVLESQGFTNEGCVAIGNDPVKAEEKNNSSLPITSSPGSHSSIVLFPSPENTACDYVSHPVVMSPDKSKLAEQSAAISKRCTIEEYAKDYACPPTCTVLARCNSVGKSVDMLAIVLQVNSTMDVACRVGMMAGQTVPMSSLLLADPTKSYFKLSLWREAAAWTERISIGDIIFFKGIRLKIWKGEVVGTTVMQSSVLNLHQPGKKLPAKVRQCVPEKSLSGLMDWGRVHYGYLFKSHSIPKSQREVKFLTSRELMRDSLIHFRAKLLHLINSRVAVLADRRDVDVHLFLLGSSACQFYSQLSGGVGKVWEFMYVAVMYEGTQTQDGIHSLQTTSRTHFRMLSEMCDAACEILKKLPSTIESVVIADLSLSDIISRRSSGVFKTRAKAVAMEFVLPDNSKLSLTSLLALPCTERISKLCQSVYVGCETCCQPLSRDENGIYCQCMPCIMKLPGGGYPKSSYFFWPLLITLSDSNSSTSITLSVSHSVVSKVLGVNGKAVLQASLSKNEARMHGMMLSVQKLYSLCSWMIKCVVTKDENSFIEELSFNLLDIVID